jgi:DNA polymerase-4/protein ImuB
VAARAAAPGRAFTVPEDVRGFLAPLPVEVLPVSWKTVTALGRFGLHRLGQIASLPLGPLQAQFGREGETAWGLARGINDRPVLPRITEEVVAESLSFPEPVAQMEALLLGIEALLSRALARSQLRNRYARGATLRVGMYRGAPWMKRVSFREPVADGRRALAVIKDSVAAVELPGPVEEIGLTLWGLTGEAGTQSSMLTEVKRRSDLRGCLRQLESRLGRRPPIYQVREVEPWSRIPERRRALVQLSP